MLTVLTQKPLFSTGKPSDAPMIFATHSRGRWAARGSDEFAVPLCRYHHRAVHRAGDERAWWRTAGVDPLKAARRLCKHTPVNKGRTDDSGHQLRHL